MADDIGGRGEDPRDVARKRLRQGIRYRAARAAANQPSGPTAIPPTQAVTPYRERLPAAGSGGGGARDGGGGGGGGGGRGMTPSAGANPPSGGGGESGSRAVSPQSRPTISVPPGSAEALRQGAGLGRGALPSRMPAIRPGPAAGAALALGLGAEAGRRYLEGRGERPITGEFEQGMEPEGTQEAADAMRREAEPVRANIPDTVVTARRPARPAGRREMTADDLNEIVLRLNRGAVPQTEVERRLADRMGIAYRKGGLVKPKKFQVGGPVKAKTHGAKEEMGEMKKGRYTGGMKEEMAEMKAASKKKPMSMMKKGGKVSKYQGGGTVRVPGKTPAMGGPKARIRMRDYISPEERKELDAPLTRAEKDRMAENGFKKGGAIKAPKKMMSGGMVPRSAPGVGSAVGASLRKPIAKRPMPGPVVSRPTPGPMPKRPVPVSRPMPGKPFKKGGMAKGKK